MDNGSDCRKVAESKLGNNYQLQLEERLRKLSLDALDNDGLYEHVRFFVNLYESEDGEDSGFRHSYAGVTNVLYGGEAPTTLEQVSNAVRTAQHISNNLDQIMSIIESSSCDKRVIRCFNKLSDHIGLETQRLSVMESVFRGVDGTNKSISELLEMQKRQFEEQNKQIDVTRKQAEGMQSQYITILGIFAAVVLVFNGAISYSTANMASLQMGATVQSVLLVAIVVGFVLANTVFVLLYVKPPLT